jgi:hypothetical protein
VVYQVLAHALVDPFVAATQQTEPTGVGQCLCHGLIKCLSAWPEKNQWSRRLRSFNGGKDWFRTHQHAGAATKWCVVHGAMHISGVFANVVAIHSHCAAFAGATQQAVFAKPVHYVGKKREDINTH